MTSTPGKGSTFWFSAMLAHGVDRPEDTQSSGSEDAEQELLAHYAGTRILLVEDNEINRQVIVEILKAVDLPVDTAENGRLAVEKARSGIYDLILMDIQMPEMDGIEATRLIRSGLANKDIPILAMTANVFEDDRQLYEEAGMNAFIGKPIDPQKLFQMLAKWLPRRGCRE